MRGYEKQFWKLNNSKNILKPPTNWQKSPVSHLMLCVEAALLTGEFMLLHSLVLGQVTQGGCVQTHHIFGSEELKALPWAHSDWKEIFYLHWGHAKQVGNCFLMRNRAACA